MRYLKKVRSDISWQLTVREHEVLTDVQGGELAVTREPAKGPVPGAPGQPRPLRQPRPLWQPRPLRKPHPSAGWTSATGTE
jgi:hypothetical protein